LSKRQPPRAGFHLTTSVGHGPLTTSGVTPSMGQNPDNFPYPFPRITSRRGVGKRIYQSLWKLKKNNVNTRRRTPPPPTTEARRGDGRGRGTSCGAPAGHRSQTSGPDPGGSVDGGSGMYGPPIRNRGRGCPVGRSVEVGGGGGASAREIQSHPNHSPTPNPNPRWVRVHLPPHPPPSVAGACGPGTTFGAWRCRRAPAPALPRAAPRRGRHRRAIGRGTAEAWGTGRAGEGGARDWGVEGRGAPSGPRGGGGWMSGRKASGEERGGVALLRWTDPVSKPHDSKT